MTAYNTDQVVVTVSDGTLLVFPAWAATSGVNEHERAPARQRNVMFTAYGTTMSPPLWGQD